MLTAIRYKIRSETTNQNSIFDKCDLSVLAMNSALSGNIKIAFKSSSSNVHGPCQYLLSVSSFLMYSVVLFCLLEFC